MTLTAPDHLTGRMSKWTPKETRDARTAWAMEAKRTGHSTSIIAAALGIRERNAFAILKAAGWDAWADKREVRP